MDYTDHKRIFTLDDAMALAREAHAGQNRDGGAPYITHVIRVVEACEPHGKDVMIVAALHDVVEDSDITLDDLVERGVPYHIVSAVDAISRRECPTCNGNGRILTFEAWYNAKQRAKEIMPTPPFSQDYVGMVVDAVLKGWTDAKCQACGGGNERLEKREDYLARVKSNALARLVKIEDSKDNAVDDARPGMFERYKWVLQQLDVPAAEIADLLPATM